MQNKPGRTEAENLMLLYFCQYKNISLYRLEQNIKIDEAEAEVSLLIVVTGSAGMLPERGARYKVKMLWHKQADDWLVYQLNWKRSQV